MEYNRITLVIGAGASKALHPEFGLGIDLVNEILSRLGDSLLRSKICLKHGDGIEMRIDDLIESLSEYKINAITPSIDQFLNEVNEFPEFKDSRIDFNRILADSINYHILGYEGRMLNNDYNLSKTFESTWLYKLISWMKQINFFEDEINIKRLKIVTFNYDRTIEHFLYEHFPKDTPIVTEFIEKSVFHIYGFVGTLPSTKSNERKVEFGAKNDDINNWQSDNIRLMYDKRNSNSNDIFKCQQYIDTFVEEKGIKQPENWFSDPSDLQVCFFGFAFDYLNCQRLNLSYNKHRKPNYFANIHPRKFDYGYNYRREVSNKLRLIRPDFNFSYLEASDFILERLSEINPKM